MLGHYRSGFEINPKCFQKVATEFRKYLMEFSTDYLTDAFKAV